jgi:hypothetical protein
VSNRDHTVSTRGTLHERLEALWLSVVIVYIFSDTAMVVLHMLFIIPCQITLAFS